MPVITETNVSGGAHGWNIDIDMRTVVSQLVRFFREVGGLGFKESHICTLLGPEGPERLGFGLV